MLNTMKPAATGQLLLVLMAFSVVHTVTCTATPGHEIQTGRLSLLEFKKGIGLDPQQALASWNDNSFLQLGRCHVQGDEQSCH
jgi:hypothetical protein